MHISVSLLLGNGLNPAKLAKPDRLPCFRQFIYKICRYWLEYIGMHCHKKRIFHSLRNEDHPSVVFYSIAVVLVLAIISIYWILASRDALRIALNYNKHLLSVEAKRVVKHDICLWC